MTQRERLQAVFDGGYADAVPWYADLTYWQHGQKLSGTLPSEYEGPEGLFKLHRDLGVGVYLFTPSLVKIEHDTDLFYSDSETLDDGIIQTTFHTPEGNLTSLAKTSETSSSTGILEWMVKEPADLKPILAWYEAATYTANYDEVLACDAHWGVYGIGMPLITRTPLAALAATWAGVVNLSYISSDAPDVLGDALKAMQRSEDEMYRLFAEAPVQAVEMGENLSAETITGLWLKYNRDYYLERTALLHDSGKLIGCHIDGTLGRLLGDIVKAGIDFPESVVPKPVGDLTLEEIRETTSPETIIWGCVPGAMFAPPYDRETVLEHVRRTIDVLCPSGALVLASADQVPPNGDIELVRLIGEEISRIGIPG
jgi:hypothetical protein